MSSPDDGSPGKDLSDWGSEQPCDGCSSEIIAASHCSKKGALMSALGHKQTFSKRCREQKSIQLARRRAGGLIAEY
jgi:hypothetical protein